MVRMVARSICLSTRKGGKGVMRTPGPIFAYTIVKGTVPFTTRQNAMCRCNLRLITANYQLQFVLIHSRSQFGDINIFMVGGLFGFAIRGHSSEGSAFGRGQVRGKNTGGVGYLFYGVCHLASFSVILVVRKPIRRANLAPLGVPCCRFLALTLRWRTSGHLLNHVC